MTALFPLSEFRTNETKSRNEEDETNVRKALSPSPELTSA